MHYVWALHHGLLQKSQFLSIQAWLSTKTMRHHPMNLEDYSLSFRGKYNNVLIFSNFVMSNSAHDITFGKFSVNYVWSCNFIIYRWKYILGWWLNYTSDEVSCSFSLKYVCNAKALQIWCFRVDFCVLFYD